MLMTRCGEGEVSAESIGQTAFPGVAPPRDANPTHPGAAGGTWTKTGPNWAKTLPREAGWSKCGVEIGEAKRKFRFRYAAERGSPAGRASRHSEDLKIGSDFIECRRPISR